MDTPNSIDITPFPTPPAIWKYRAINTKDSQRPGQWSNFATISLGAWANLPNPNSTPTTSTASGESPRPLPAFTLIFALSRILESGRTAITNVRP